MYIGDRIKRNQHIYESSAHILIHLIEKNIIFSVRVFIKKNNSLNPNVNKICI